MNRNRLFLLMLGLSPTLLAGCGFEELLIGAIIGEPGTPEPGTIPEGAAQLSGIMPGLSDSETLSFYSAGGVELEPVILNVDAFSTPPTFYAVLPPSAGHLFNVRVVVESGSVIQKIIVADPYADDISAVDSIDAVSTTLALALESVPLFNEAFSPRIGHGPSPWSAARADALEGELVEAPPQLGAHACDGVDQFNEALLGQIALGSGPAAELYAEVSAQIGEGSTSWPAVVYSPDDLEEPLRSLASSAANSASTDTEGDPDTLRVIMTVARIQSYPDARCIAVNIDKWVNPSSGDRMFFTGGIHADSPVQDANIQNDVFPNWIPNTLPMYDDGTHGDLHAGDDLWAVSFALPAGLRFGYKYTFGQQGENWTGTEEWPGNQRIMETVDVNGDGYVARFDIFADESSNKDKNNLYVAGGTDISWDSDLNNDGYLESREQPADFAGADCVKDGWWQPRTLPPVTVNGCF